MAVNALKLARDLIRINSVNPPGGELACVALLENVLRGHGFKTARFDFGPGRANLIATWGEASPGHRLSFTGHVDTVPLGAATWSHDPFGAAIDGDRLYGRGSSDMKAGVAAFVAASCDVVSSRLGGGRLSLVITAGEETGCEGARDLAAKHRFEPEDLLVVAEPTANIPLVGHKGVAWFQFKLKGITAHGSMPQEGINAALRASELITRLSNMRFNVHHEHLGAPTLNVGSVHAGKNINSVPDLAEIAVDCRTVPGIDHIRLNELFNAEIGDGDTLETLLALDSVWTEPSSPALRKVFQIVNDVTGGVQPWKTAPYFTDAAVLTPAMDGPATVVLGPGEPTMAHKIDEYCSVDRLAKATEIFRRIAAYYLEH
jgi:succinyl-diaminopimelate desuccinylase